MTSTDPRQTTSSLSLFDDDLLSFNLCLFDGTGPFLFFSLSRRAGLQGCLSLFFPHLSGTVPAVDQPSFHELSTSTPCDECASRNASHPSLFRIPTRRKGGCHRESIIARDFFQPGVYIALRYIVRIRLRDSLHPRPLLYPSLGRRGSILRHLQTNHVPESFARSILLPLPTRAICRLFGAQQLDQGRERMDRYQVDP